MEKYRNIIKKQQEIIEKQKDIIKNLAFENSKLREENSIQKSDKESIHFKNKYLELLKEFETYKKNKSYEIFKLAKTKNTNQKSSNQTEIESYDTIDFMVDNCSETNKELNDFDNLLDRCDKDNLESKEKLDKLCSKIKDPKLLDKIQSLMNKM